MPTYWTETRAKGTAVFQVTNVLGYFVTQPKLTDTSSQGPLRKNAGPVFQENPSVVRLEGTGAMFV